MLHNILHFPSASRVGVGRIPSVVETDTLVAVDDDDDGLRRPSSLGLPYKRGRILFKSLTIVMSPVISGLGLLRGVVSVVGVVVLVVMAHGRYEGKMQEGPGR